MMEARPLGDSAPAPFYLVTNATLARPARAGEAIRPGDLMPGEASPLPKARLDQDTIFFS